MNNLESMMDEIKQLKAIVDTNPGTDVQKRRFLLGKIRQAKEKLELKYMEYRREVIGNSIFILSVGSKAKEFADLAKDSYDCFTVRVDDFYEDILSKVPSKIYMNKNASRQMFEHIAARFEDRAAQIDIVGYQSLVFEAKYKKVIDSEEEALDMVKRAINEKIGAEVAALDAIEKVSIQAVNSDFKGKVIPIVLYTEDEKLAEELMKDIPRMTKNLFLINVGKKLQKDLQKSILSDITEVNKENVEKVLMKIKEKI